MDMDKIEAVLEAKRIAEKSGWAFAIYWPLNDRWTATEQRPSLRAPGMKIIEVAEDGRETEVF